MLFKLYSIKPSSFTETKVCVKLDPEAENTAHTLLSPKLCYHLLTIELSTLGNYQQTPNKIVKNEGKNKKLKQCQHLSLMSLFTRLLL